MSNHARRRIPRPGLRRARSEGWVTTTSELDTYRAWHHDQPWARRRRRRNALIVALVRDLLRRFRRR